MFAGEDNENIGRLERLIIADDDSKDVDEEDEDDLQPIYSPPEIAGLSKYTKDEPREDADPQEVAGMEEWRLCVYISRIHVLCPNNSGRFKSAHEI